MPSPMSDRPFCTMNTPMSVPPPYHDAGDERQRM
jgi:hypothetical protein